MTGSLSYPLKLETVGVSSEADVIILNSEQS